MFKEDRTKNAAQPPGLLTSRHHTLGGVRGSRSRGLGRRTRADPLVEPGRMLSAKLARVAPSDRQQGRIAGAFLASSPKISYCRSPVLATGLAHRRPARGDEREEARKSVERLRRLVQDARLASATRASLDRSRLRALVRDAASLSGHRDADQGDRQGARARLRHVARSASHRYPDIAYHRGAQSYPRQPSRLVSSRRRDEGGDRPRQAAAPRPAGA